MPSETPSRPLPRALASLLAAAVALVGAVQPSLANAATVGSDGKPITNAKGDTFGVLAHRGGADERPENSLEAIQYSVAQGFDSIEIDLQFTSDGWGVLSHNDTLPSRCTQAGKKIHQLTWAQVQQVRCADLDGNKTVPIPSIYQFVGAVQNSTIGITLDLKAYSGQSSKSKRAYAAKAIYLLKRYNLLERSRILTFHWASMLSTIRQKAPTIYVIALDDQKMELARVRKAAKLGASAYGIMSKYTSAFLSKYIRAQGMDPLPWEVKGTAQRASMIYFGGKVQLFSTDTPSRTVRSLVRGTIDLNPKPRTVGTSLATPVVIAQGTFAKKKSQYPKALGPAVPSSKLIGLDTVTLRITVTNGPGKGYVSVAPSGSLNDSEVRRKLPKGTKALFVKVAVGDWGKLRIFTSVKATLKIEVKGYTNLVF